MSLLSDADKLEIREAIKSVTDTFFVTPIFFHNSKGNLDTWNEDKLDETFDTYLVYALAEPSTGTSGDYVQKMKEGNTDFDGVTLSFNFEDFLAMGLIDTATIRVIFQAEADYFQWKGKIYEVLDISYDGPLDSQEVLIVVAGKLTDTAIKFDSVTVSNGAGGTEIRTLSDVLNQLLEPHEHIKFEDLPSLPDN